MYMGKRQEMARKGALVRDLIDDNQYIEALQILDEMDLEAVESTADLNLFADLYEKAERIDKKKDIYYILYKKDFVCCKVQNLFCCIDNFFNKKQKNTCKTYIIVISLIRYDCKDVQGCRYTRQSCLMISGYLYGASLY